MRARSGPLCPLSDVIESVRESFPTRMVSSSYTGSLNLITIATAIRYDECDALHSGDPDFESLDETETVVL